MERSGHLSVSGVRSYERTTSMQLKQVSDVLSGQAESVQQRMPLKELSSNDDTSQETKQERDLMKQFSFEQVHGCTFNFSFTSGK